MPVPENLLQSPESIPFTPQPAPDLEPQSESPQELPQEGGFLDEAIDSLKRTLRMPKKQKPTIVPQVKDALTAQIEKIMEDGLSDAYREMTPVQQQEFKIKGEETAWKIKTALQKTKVKIKEIFKLLVEWLKLLPGVNYFFIEQEAKIKADKLIAVKNYLNNKQ